MPETAGVELEARVAALIEQHRPELAQLVDQALTRELAQLVEERIAATNGDVEHEVHEARQEPVVTSADVTKTCVGCGRTLPASAFEARRLKCRACRRGEERERARRRTAEPEPAEPDRPVPPPTPPPPPAAIAPAELAERARVDARPPAPDLTSWLVDEELVLEVDGLLAPTSRCVELGAGIA